MYNDLEARRYFYAQLLASHTEHYGAPTEFQKDYLRQLVHDMVTDLGLQQQRSPAHLRRLSGASPSGSRRAG